MKILDSSTPSLAAGQGGGDSIYSMGGGGLCCVLALVGVAPPVLGQPWTSMCHVSPACLCGFPPLAPAQVRVLTIIDITCTTVLALPHGG